MGSRKEADQRFIDPETGNSVNLKISDPRKQKNRSAFKAFVQLNFTGALVLASEFIKPSERALLLYILATMVDNNEWLFIAKKASNWTGVSEEFLRYAVDRLAEVGCIAVIGKVGSLRLFRLNPYIAWSGSTEDWTLYIQGWPHIIALTEQLKISLMT